MRTHYCGQINTQHIDQEIVLCGWAHRRRDHGGVIFIDLRDREGLAQIVCNPEQSAMFAIAESIRNEYCLKVTGKVRGRPEGTVNPNMATGEVEVLCQKIEILSASLTPPFHLDDENLSETVRLQNRMLDLRRPQMQRNMMLRYKTARAFRRFLDEAGLAIEKTVKEWRGDMDSLRESVRLAVRRVATSWTGKKPIVDVLIVETA